MNLHIKDSLQQQIHLNGNVFGNKCRRYNEVRFTTFIDSKRNGP